MQRMEDNMKPTVDYQSLAFDVERALSKALGMRWETFECRPDITKIRIGSRWNLVLDREQLETLWDQIDHSSALREAFDALKAECLVFQSLSSQRG